MGTSSGESVIENPVIVLRVDLAEKRSLLLNSRATSVMIPILEVSYFVSMPEAGILTFMYRPKRISWGQSVVGESDKSNVTCPKISFLLLVVGGSLAGQMFASKTDT